MSVSALVALRRRSSLLVVRLIPPSLLSLLSNRSFLPAGDFDRTSVHPTITSVPPVACLWRCGGDLSLLVVPVPSLLLLSPSFLHDSCRRFRPVLPSRPSPDRGTSLGGPGLGAPGIPPSRAGFPLRPRPLGGSWGVWSPVDRSASQFGAGSLPPGCGGHCARSRVEGGGGVCRQSLRLPGGCTGPGA